MRLSNFILDVQRLEATDISNGTFECESSTTSSNGKAIDPKIKTDKSNTKIFQCATIEHTSNTLSGSFHNLIVSGTITQNNVWSGDRLKMTGSFSSTQIDSDGEELIALQVLMLSDSEFTG